MIYDRYLRLTPARLKEMNAEIEAIVERYAEDPADGDDAGAERVMAIFQAFPQRGEP